MDLPSPPIPSPRLWSNRRCGPPCLPNRARGLGLRLRRALRWSPLALSGMAWGGMLPLPLPAQQPPPPPPAVLWGSVVEHGTRLPLLGASVSLAAGPGGTVGLGTRVTDAQGRFRFDSVPPGTYILVVELLGYHTRRDTLHVEAATHLEAFLPLSTTPIPLEAIVVVADARRPWFLEEAQRRARGRGATLLTREEIEARAALHFTDLLRTVAGVSVAPSRRGALVRMRGGCRPDVIVDGVRTVPDMPLDDILRPDDVELVEIYPGVNAPPEYSNSPCGAILVWTRRGDPAAPKGGFWKRLALALTFLTLGYFLTR